MIPEFNCATLDELRVHIERFSREIGFTQYGYIAQLRAPRAGSDDDVHAFTNIAPAWSDEVRAAVHGGRLHNLVRHASLPLPAFGWSTKGHLAGHIILDELARSQVRVQAERGVEAGVVCPIAAPEVKWGALVFHSPHPMNYRALQQVLPSCALYAGHFSFWYLQLACRNLATRGRPKLTRRESQCLDWAAQGKTSAEIGSILGIGDRTVETYIGSACGKLDARGRQAAITKARDLQLIGGPRSLLDEFARQRDEATQARGG